MQKIVFNFRRGSMGDETKFLEKISSTYYLCNIGQISLSLSQFEASSL